MRSPEELRDLVESYLDELALTPELHGQAESVRYALEGGKRVRAVICLATAEAAGDHDETRRGRPSVWARYGEATAVLAGDALLAEAFRLALSYPTPNAGRELAQATLGMIGGQYLDITDGAPDEETLHRL